MLPPGAAFALLAASIAMALALWWSQAPQPEPPRADALRYLDYAVSLHEHGVFGLHEHGTPVAGRENTPLYPAFLAVVFRLHGITAMELRCYLAEQADCDPAMLEAVHGAQVVLAGIALLGIGLTAWWVLGQRAAWLAAGAGLLCGQLRELTGQLLTENLSVLLFAWLGLTLLAACRRGARWYLASGVLLGLLALNRPEFAYLAGATVTVALASATRRALRSRALLAAALLAVGFALPVAPWAARNAAQFGDPALTGSYGGRVLAQRVRYNAMSPAEIGVAFIYWLPDFGDNLAERTFSPTLWERLDFGPGSYYSTGLDYYDAVEQRSGGPEGVVRTLLVEDVLGHPFKHAAVTAALAWRAIFVGKLWGLVGLVALAAALVRLPSARGPLLLLSAPALFMLAFYAAVSVSIPRYAVCFIPVFSLAWAALFVREEAAP